MSRPTNTRSFRLNWIVCVAMVLLARHGLCGHPKSERYVRTVRAFADAVLEHGRDTYGEKRTPLLVDGLHVETMEPARWLCRGETWVLSNFASQQPLLRTLDGLTVLTEAPKYRKAAEDATRYALHHLGGPNGLLYWGGHLAWDLEAEKPVGQYADVHELKGHQPYYRLMWRVDPQNTARLMKMIWAGHVVDWSLLDYNRHASVRNDYQPGWDRDFADDVEVPFPAQGGNLSFVNVTPPLLHAAVMQAILGEDEKALTWSRRLVMRWQQARHPETGLSGGQLSYREHDRAQDALGHVHPEINEAKIVASYHQSSRYHDLPLAQMQAAEILMAAGGRYAEVGRELIRWASDDLKAYARHCYDSENGVFIALMTDGTPIRWKESRTGYYVPESFAPRRPDGFLLWGYALAYRLTRDAAHRRMVEGLGAQLGLGELGRSDNSQQPIESDTDSRDWRLIYALLELHQAGAGPHVLTLACRIADNILETQTPTGLFPRTGRKHARTGDEIPLAILHLAAVMENRRQSIPRPALDRRFFHCEYHGELEEHQKKRADKRTYDDLVFFGGS